MSADPTDRLIRQLSEDVEPVQPIAPLWLSFGIVLALSSLVGLGFLYFSGVVDDVVSLALGGGPYGAIALGLALAGVFGGLAALAEGIPGRARVVTFCAVAAVLGLGWAAGSALSVWWSQGFESAAPIAADRMCLRNALLLSVLPTLAVVALLARGWVGRPARAAVLALAGGAAIGSLVMHLSCGLHDARHLLFGHAGPPWVWVVLLAAPLAFWIRRMAR